MSEETTAAGGARRTSPDPASVRSRTTAPAPRTPQDDTPAGPSGTLAAKVRAVRDTDAETEAVRRFELIDHDRQDVDELDSLLRDPQEWVARRRVAPGWLQPYSAIVIGGDLLLAAVGAITGILVAGEAEPLWLAAPFAVVLVVTALLARAYEHRYVGAGIEEFRRLGAASVVVLALASTVAYAVGADARGLVLVGSALAAIITQLWHAAARQVLYALRRRGLCTYRVVVIGLERSVDELIERLGRQPDGGVQVVAACVRRSREATIRDVPVAGTPDEARGVVRRHRAHAILLTAWSEVGEEDLRRLSWEIEGTGIQLFVAPRLTEVAVPRLHVQNVGGVPLLHVDEPEFTGVRRVAKGLLDLVLTLIALTVFAPLMVAIAVAIKLDSRGPVFFRQQRIGKHGKPFPMTKFRSMYTDAEARLAQLTDLNELGGGPMFKMKDDPRVTRVGGLLRKYSLDELPQLFDVLRRDMSVVGPRPPLPREVAQYEQHVHRRLLVKPGITGLWQVSGRSDLSWEETVRLDLRYVENWSLGFDLSIIARTVVAVLARRGAY